VAVLLLLLLLPFAFGLLHRWMDGWMEHFLLKATRQPDFTARNLFLTINFDVCELL